MAADLVNGELWCDAACALTKSNGHGNDCFDIDLQAAVHLHEAETVCTQADGKYMFHVQNEYDEGNAKELIRKVLGGCSK